MSNQKTEKGIELFLRQQMFRERDIPLEKFVLRHAGVGTKGSVVDEFPIAGQLTPDSLPVWREDIMSRAQNYADSMPSGKWQRFLVEAVVEGAKTGPRFAFRLQSEGEEDDESGDTEAPTEKGLTSQLMRHNEALMRMLVMTTGSSVQHLQRQLEKAGETITELVSQQTEQRKIIETANTEQHERDMQMLLTSGQEDRKSALFKQFEALLPVVIRKATGMPLLSEKEQSIIGPFFDALTEDQVRAIAGHLTQPQQIALFKVYQEVKAASQKQTPPNGVS